MKTNHTPGLSMVDDVILFLLATVSIAVLAGLAIWGVTEGIVWLMHAGHVDPWAWLSNVRFA